MEKKGERKEAMTIELGFNCLVNFAYFQNGFKADNKTHIYNQTIITRIKVYGRMEKTVVLETSTLKY